MAGKPTGEIEQLVASFFPEASGESAKQAGELLARLAEEWRREAKGKAHPESIREFQEQDLSAALGDSQDEARMDALHGFLLQRRAEQLGLRTLSLGKEILSGEATDPQAKTRGAALLKEVERLAAEGKTLGTIPPALQREIGEAMMEALYAVERKGMSQRLQRESG
jgi:hypothetical protein